MKKNTVIEVRKISKQYFIGDSVPYITLRDQIANLPKKVFSILSPKKENKFWALKDVSFKAREGEVIGIIGRNGAGKSTILKILSQITEPTNGKAVLEGRVASLLEVGTGFNPELTGRENIFLSGAIIGMSKKEIRNKLQSIINFSGINNFIDTPVKRYSSGMYVRLAFSVAAHLEADILLIDEVLAVGDAEFQKKCLGKMGNMVDSGRTILFVSHNMSAISGLCSKTIWMDEGRIRAFDKTSKVIESYLGSASKNVDMDLSKISQREGLGNLKIEKINLKNSKGKKIKSAETGKDLQIEIKYSSDKKSKDVKVGIAITNSFGQIITNLNSYHAKTKYKTLGKKGSLVCKIKKLPIMSGSYHLTISISREGVLEDMIEYPQTLQVESGRFFEDGPSGINPKFQGIHIEQEWS